MEAHRGQVDKAGSPYILHPLRLMFKMDSESEMSVAVLHDTVEDTELTFESLEKEGFSQEVIEAVRCLTRKDEETYEHFVLRAKTNPIARKVKLADIEDNMNLRRLETVQGRDLERLRKYHGAWKTLKFEDDSKDGSASTSTPEAKPQTPGMKCLKCENDLGDAKTRAAVICMEITGDEHIDSYWQCTSCGFYTKETYHDSFMGSSNVTLHGPIDTEKGDAIIAAIKKCPDPSNKRCKCDSHRSLSGGN